MMHPMEVSTVDAILWEVGNPLALFNSLSAKSVLAGEKLVATYSISI
jgi:hypothetical protein